MSNEAVRKEWSTRFGVRPEDRVGLNYSDHTAESGFKKRQGAMFGVRENTLCADGDPIVLPLEEGHVDAEAELAVVIGKVASRVAADDAYDVIAGYTCANDVSHRDVQFAEGQWFRGKGFDTFCPVGHVVLRAVPTRRTPDQQRLNGEVLQDSRTSTLIFDIPYLVSFISQTITLEPGDLILTGTPFGVGVFVTEDHALRPGDVVEVEVEGIGILRNEVNSAAT